MIIFNNSLIKKIKKIKKKTILDSKCNIKYIKFYFYLKKKSKKQKHLVCFNNKRNKGLYKFFGLSRQSIKEYANKEVLPGLIKSSW